jgi:sugar lactone lactonase YvrE
VRILPVRMLVVVLLAFATASCVQHKAEIDYTMAEGIIWPGPPEKPRIQYLWSVQRVSGGEGTGKFARFIAGEEYEIKDPRTSAFLVKPHGLFVDRNDILYIADPGAFRVSVIDLKTMDSFNISEAADVFLFSPMGVVAAPDGRIYVTDAELASVFVFNRKGKLVATFEGKFKRPTGIAINLAEGLIYVADTWAHTIYIYGLDGQRRGAVGERGDSPGKLNYPTHISVDSNGFLYVSDTLNFKVQVFSGTGEFVNAFGLAGDAFNTFDKIKGIAVDNGGRIYIVDSAQDMVKIFDRHGRLLLFFGRKGNFYGSFSLPTGIHIDETGRIFVSDALNGRVQVFRYIGQDISAAPP